MINRTEQNKTEWHLFNIKADAGEVSDLRDKQPQLFEEILADYEMSKQANSVMPISVRYNRGRTIFRSRFN